MFEKRLYSKDKETYCDFLVRNDKVLILDLFLGNLYKEMRLDNIKKAELRKVRNRDIVSQIIDLFNRLNDVKTLEIRLPEDTFKNELTSYLYTRDDIEVDLHKTLKNKNNLYINKKQ